MPKLFGSVTERAKKVDWSKQSQTTSHHRYYGWKVDIWSGQSVDLGCELGQCQKEPINILMQHGCFMTNRFESIRNEHFAII